MKWAALPPISFNIYLFFAYSLRMGIFYPADFNVSCLKKIEGGPIHTVIIRVNQAGNTCVNQRFGAVYAGEVGDVTTGPFGGYPVQCRLDNCVGFCMNGPNTVAFHNQMAKFIAMGESGRRSIEPGCQNPFVQNQHTSHIGPITRTPFRNRVCNFHEI
jgi:hypothetical protein